MLAFCVSNLLGNYPVPTLLLPSLINTATFEQSPIIFIFFKYVWQQNIQGQHYLKFNQCCYWQVFFCRILASVIQCVNEQYCIFHIISPPPFPPQLGNIIHLKAFLILLGCELKFLIWCFFLLNRGCLKWENAALKNDIFKVVRKSGVILIVFNDGRLREAFNFWTNVGTAFLVSVFLVLFVNVYFLTTGQFTQLFVQMISKSG
eukprot:TRINITY_DN16847_c0_g1_i14.p1 TRINITY_DN16847_c0_g1~~TRINITY_DN16847_c0_g1_i14.p1  ORF type:complete len:204 (-),score=-3.82 TRINITY_DN16847_c0_g1_i14:132-743(-)